MQWVQHILKLSLRNIRRHPVKNVLTGVMILLSSLAFFFSASLSKNSELGWRGFLGKTFLGHYHVTAYAGLDRDYSFSSYYLPDAYITDELTRYLDENKVEYARRVKLGAVVYNRDKGEFENTLCTVIGMDMDAELKKLTNMDIVQGKYDPSNPNGALIWKEYADFLKLKVGDEITVFLRDVDNGNYPYTFTVTGIYFQKEGSNIQDKAYLRIFPLVLVPYRQLTTLLGVEPGRATEIAIWDFDERHSSAVRSIAKKHKMEFMYGEEIFAIIFGTVDFLHFLGGFLGVIILTILVVSTLNINMISFFERQKEIGTIIAIGGRARWVVTLLVSELVTFSTVAVIISIVIYLGLSAAMSIGVDFGESSVLFAGNRFYMGLVGKSVLPTYVTIVVTMLVSALYPIYLSTRINPVDTFREGEL
ncbi:MAG TPA: hypothetical protein PKM65_04870 [Spirochaetota bacterium]|nr:hypothetical protein [Spirochaetota bacterium]HNT10588.1 hypothetical protein [Spirochaetota bacterium]